MPERNVKAAVFGIYSTREGAEVAMNALLHGRFAPGDIERPGPKHVDLERAAVDEEGARRGADPDVDKRKARRVRAGGRYS